jgi:hypothetical protein
MDIDDNELNFKEILFLTDIGDLAEMCKSKCETKYLSTLLYMSLRFFDIKWEEVDGFLKSIGSLKLFRRFWRAIEAYSQGQTYADVLKLFFSQLCKSTIQSHRKITNTNINEN